MIQFKYVAYLAITGAVLLDLYSGRPEASSFMRVSLDGVALILAAIGIGGIVLGRSRVRRPS